MTFDLGGDRLQFVDPRRFGTGELALGDEALDDFFAGGWASSRSSPEFTGEHLRAGARARAPIKAMLLDQKRIAGVGNIYADEALFRARIHPWRRADRITRKQAALLRDAVVETLQLGIDSRGATIDDFRDPDGVRGSFQDRFLIHLREGEPCVRCGRPVRKLRAAGRGTYVCERCQPRPRRRGPGRPAASASTRSSSTPVAVGLDQLLVAADRLSVDDDLGERHHAREANELGTALGIASEVDLLVGDAALGQQGLRGPAIATGVSRVHAHATHYFSKHRRYPLAGSLKTEGVVLRSMRYGEADRILHLYTPQRGG